MFAWYYYDNNITTAITVNGYCDAKIIAIAFAPYERGFSGDCRQNFTVFLGSHKILLSAMTCLVSGYTTVIIRLNVIRSLSQP